MNGPFVAAGRGLFQSTSLHAATRLVNALVNFSRFTGCYDVMRNRLFMRQRRLT